MKVPKPIIRPRSNRMVYSYILKVFCCLVFLSGMNYYQGGGSGFIMME